MRTKYPKEMTRKVWELLDSHTNAEIAEILNEEYGLDMNATLVKNYIANHKLHRTERVTRPRVNKVWIPEYEEFLRQNYKGVGPTAMATMLNKEFGTDFSRNQVKGVYRRMGLDSGLTGWFERGGTAWNKGMKGLLIPGSEKTQFKPGNRPANWEPVGAIKITTDGYYKIKIEDPDKWEPLSWYIWRLAGNGEVPKGHAIIYKDGNKLNCLIENLRLVTRRELLVLSRSGMRSNDPDVTDAAVNIAKLNIAIKEKQNGKKEKGSRKATAKEAEGVADGGDC